MVVRKSDPPNWSSAMKSRGIRERLGDESCSNMCSFIDEEFGEFAVFSHGTLAQVQEAVLGLPKSTGLDTREPEGAFHAGWPPLRCAARDNRDPAVVTYLLSQGADPNVVSGVEVASALHSASSWNPTVSVLDVLIQSAAALEATAAGGMMPLDFAVMQNRNPDITSALIRAGAPIAPDICALAGRPRHGHPAGGLGYSH